MTLGQLITEARLKRRRELDAQLRALTAGREPETGEETAAWAERVRQVEAELRLLEDAP